MVNKKRLIEIFLNLVKIDSPTGEEEKVARYVLGILKSMKINCFKDKFNNVVARMPGSGEPILLAAHLDTVEPGRKISPIVKNGKIISDGKTILGADNKVAVAAIIEAIAVIKESGIITRPIDIVFTSAEESGNYGAIYLDYSKIEAREGYCFDVSQSIGTIITSSPFYDRLDAQILGKSAHASLPEKGVNALMILSDILKQIKLGRINKNTLVNIGILQGGDARNTVPEKIFLKGEIRSFLQKEQDAQIEKIKKAFKNAVKKYNGKFKLEFIRENKGYIYADNDELIIKTKEIILKQKLKPILQSVGGCSDANIFIEKGIKALNLGNGAKNAHTIREEIKISQFIKLTELIISLIQFLE